MTDTVVLFKLSTGEEIVGQINEAEADADQIVIVKPRTLMMVQGRSPQEMGMTLVPFLMGNQDGDIAVFRNHIVATSKPNADLEKGYLQNTTGLDLTSKM